jgi:hypothetical protein
MELSLSGHNQRRAHDTATGDGDVADDDDDDGAGADAPGAAPQLQPAAGASMPATNPPPPLRGVLGVPVRSTHTLLGRGTRRTRKARGASARAGGDNVDDKNDDEGEGGGGGDDDDDGIDVPCAWGAVLLSMCFAASFAAFAVKPVLGGTMLLLTLFLVGSWCLHHPPDGAASRVCKVILVLVAAVYGVFTSAYATSISSDPLFVLDPAWSGRGVGVGVGGSALGGGGGGGAPVTLATFAAATSARRYDVCDTAVHGLSVLDHCFLAVSAYRPSVRGAEVTAWFGAGNVSVVPIPLPPSRTGVDAAAYLALGDAAAGTADRVFVSIRGTVTARDMSQDALLWQEAVFWSLLSSLGPFGSWPVSVAQAFIGLVGTFEASFGVEDQLAYADELFDLAADLRSAFPNATLSFSGHSLGGGLSTITGQRVGASSVSFSGPGVVLSARKFRLPEVLAYDASLVILPDSDVVPRIDRHAGAVQNVRCMHAASALACHSVVRTCCELARNCGDPAGRSLAQCPTL